MGICYNLSDKKSGSFGFNPYEYSGSKQYAKHFGNLCYLSFIANNRGSSFAEKYQAEKEMIVAKRKMKYWERVAKVQGELELIVKYCAEEKKKWAI